MSRPLRHRRGVTALRLPRIVRDQRTKRCLHTACNAEAHALLNSLAQQLDFRLWALEAALAAAGWAYLKRPRGWSSGAVVVRQSPIHGKGVFASRDISAGEVLGCYPGLVRPPEAVRSATDRW